MPAVLAGSRSSGNVYQYCFVVQPVHDPAQQHTICLPRMLFTSHHELLPSWSATGTIMIALRILTIQLFFQIT